MHLKVDTGMHRVGCRPDEAVELASQVVGPARARAGRRVHAPRGRRRARQPVHAASSSRSSTRCSAICARAWPADRNGARVQHRGRASSGPQRALRPRARRHRLLRDRARRRPRRPRRAAARDGGEGTRLAREGRARGRAACRTGCATRRVAPTTDRDRADRLRRRRAARAAAAGRRRARARTALPDGGHRHDGPADARRRRPAGRGRRRGRADRPAGRRGDHRSRLGARDGHDRLHDRVRHRPARPACTRHDRPGADPEPVGPAGVRGRSRPEVEAA